MDEKNDKNIFKKNNDPQSLEEFLDGIAEKLAEIFINQIDFEKNNKQQNKN